MELELGEQESLFFGHKRFESVLQGVCLSVYMSLLCFSSCVFVLQRFPSIYRGLRKALEGLRKVI